MNDAVDNSADKVELDAAQPERATKWHREMLTYLQQQESELWKWFSSHKARQKSADSVRLELLKTGYRLNREDDGDIYDLAGSVAKKMKLTSDVTIYQAEHAVGLNASLAWLPNEAHVILHGPVQETLSRDELAALLAHELAHHELYSVDEGAFLVMEQVLSAILADQNSNEVHERTLRSHRLYTELYCDRRAAQVTDRIEDCVCALIKLATGFKEVSASAYFEQADEVLADSGQKSKGSDGFTHPEMFIRAKALQLWREDPATADDVISQLIEGPLELSQLDFLRQRKVRQLTEEFLQTFLAPRWLQTDLTRAHAKHFFEDIALPESDMPLPSHKLLKGRVAECDEQLQNYFCYLLLDFVTFDPDLEEGPLAAAFLFSAQVGLADTFRSLAAKELKFGKRALQKVEADASKIVEQAERAHSC